MSPSAYVLGFRRDALSREISGDFSFHLEILRIPTRLTNFTLYGVTEILRGKRGNVPVPIAIYSNVLRTL